MQRIPIPPFAPDSGDLNTSVASLVYNLKPEVSGYSPMPSFVADSDALTEEVRGTYSYQDRYGRPWFFAGTLKGVYVLRPYQKQWERVLSLVPPLAGEFFWSFTDFGDNIITTNGVHRPYKFEIDEDARKGRFFELGGDPPIAKYVAKWGDYVVLMNHRDQPNKLQWSGLNDPDWWTVGERSSGYQVLPDGGAIQGSTRGVNPFIILENAVYKAQYAPFTSLIFNFILFQDNIGAVSSASIVPVEDRAYFVSYSGIVELSNAGVVNISTGVLQNWLGDNITSYDQRQMTGSVVPQETQIYWTLSPTTRTGGGGLTIIYDYSSKKWSLLSIGMVNFFVQKSKVTTLVEMNSYGTLVDIEEPLSSGVWQGVWVVRGLSADGVVGNFSGDSMEAYIETSEISTGLRKGWLGKLFIETDGVWYAEVMARNRRTQRWVGSGYKKVSWENGTIYDRYKASYFKIKIVIPHGQLEAKLTYWGYDLTDAGK